MSTPSDVLVEVRLLGLPVQLQDEASRHMAALQRELEIIRLGEQDVHTVPHRLQALIDELDGRFGSFGDEASGLLQAAVERGDTAIDLTYRLPAAAGEAARRLGELLDEADDFCRAGEHLLTVVTPPELLRYRRWFLREFERQAAGLPPIPWAEHTDTDDTTPADGAGENATRESPGGPAPAVPEGWAVEQHAGCAKLTVAGPLDLESAPVLRDALVGLIAEVPHVTVDLAGCDFLDSVGVSVLLAAVARADEHGTVVSFRLGEAAARVLAIAGLLDRLRIEA